MFRKRGLKFSGKDYTIGGLISLSLGLVAAATIIYAIWISFSARGQGDIMVGNLGVISLLISFFGLIFGLISYREEDRDYRFSFIGTLLSGIVFILLIFFILVNI